MKRAATFAMVAAIAVCASLPLTGQTPAAPPMHHHMPLPKPTNLQVLPKDISPEDLMKTMHGYAGALSVHCNFCHEVNEKTHKADFAADTKPDKAIARTMIAMTQEINAKYLSQVKDPDATPADKTVTCGTCHRGHEMPAQFVPKPEAHAHPMGGAPKPK